MINQQKIMGSVLRLSKVSRSIVKKVLFDSSKRKINKLLNNIADDDNKWYNVKTMCHSYWNINHVFIMNKKATNKDQN